MKAAIYHTGKHLSAPDLYPATGECPICGFTGTRPARVDIQKNPVVTLRYCPDCRGLSASLMPSHGALGEYYGSYYGDSSHERVTFYKPERLARHILQSIHVPDSSRFKIMDFGGGDGTIALKIAQYIAAKHSCKVDIEVVDYATGSSAQDGLISIKFLRDLDAATADCDLVIASAVFEHIPDLKTVLPKVFGKLKPGGYLYVRTPYMYPMIKLLSFDMTFPAHVHDLGSAFWSTLTKWFPIPLSLVRSSPAIVESGFSQKSMFVRTLAAYMLKAPAYIECLYTNNPFWKLYGGWEAVFQRWR